MKIDIPIEVSGLFIFHVFKADDAGGEIPGSRNKVAEFTNLITDNGLNLLGTSAAWLTACQVGSGTSTPRVADTSLASRVAASSTSSSNITGNSSTAPFFAWRRKTFRFTPGVASGNISEVGVGPDIAGNLFSRALILDSQGNPTTLTILSDETLDVTYEIRYFAPESDVTIPDLMIGEVSHSVTCRAARVTSAAYWGLGVNGTAATLTSATVFSGDISAITSSPSGETSNSSAASTSAYSANSYMRRATAEWGLASGNFTGGIKSCAVGLGAGFYQYSFTPAIAKNINNVLSLTFQHSWARRA